MPNPYTDDVVTINLPTLDPNANASRIPNASVNPFGTSFSLPLANTWGGASRVGEFPNALNAYAGHTPNPRVSFTPLGANPNEPGQMGNQYASPNQWYAKQKTTPLGNTGGLHPDEAKWKGIAEKLGLNWAVVKDVYMSPSRNGTPNVSSAIGRAADDKAWGDAAAKYGVLTGEYWHDRQVWIDHYNAGGNMQYDPLVGHNDAIATYQQNQQAMEQQANGTPQYPEWYAQP